MKDSDKWLVLEMERMHRHISRQMRQLIPRERWIAIQSYQGWRPPTDVYETEDMAVVRVEIAGAHQDAFQVSFADHVLSVTGHRDDPADKLAYQQMEISYGEFRTDVFIPWQVTEDGIEATYEDGILVVQLPKAPASRRVPVQTGVEKNSEGDPDG